MEPGLSIKFFLKVLISIFIITSRCLQAEKSFEEDERAILAGIEAYPGQFPYIVFIKARTVNHTKFIGIGCTGSIIAPKWVVTSYHCFANFLANKIRLDDLKIDIKAGSIDREILSKEAQKRKGARVILLPKNQSKTISDSLNNDIAIIEANRKFKITLYVKPITIAKHPLPYDRDRKCTVIGYGHTERPPLDDKDFLNNTILHYTYMKFTADKWECRKLAEMNNNFPLRDWDGSQICLHPIHWNKVPCHGDSGGPLVCDGLLVGTSSSRLNVSPEKIYQYCGRVGNYHIYAFAGLHEEWFRENIPKLPPFIPLAWRKGGKRHNAVRHTSANDKTMNSHPCLTAYFIVQFLITFIAF